jgi:6-phosphofructokinase 1
VVRAADAARIESFGITSGYDGLIKGNLRPLGPRDVGDINHRGGTILRTARCPEMLDEEGRARARHNLAAEGIDALVVIGGDGSLRAAHLLDKEGMPAVGVPASIDNDLWGTTMAIGVDTALNTIVGCSWWRPWAATAATWRCSAASPVGPRWRSSRNGRPPWRTWPPR